MEKNLQQMQFKDRLCRTLLRINWLIAIVAIACFVKNIHRCGGYRYGFLLSDFNSRHNYNIRSFFTE